MTTKHWIKGLVGALIGGVANAIALCVADPVTFNLSAGFKKLAETAAISGLVAAAFYLKQSPVPPDDTTTTNPTTTK